MLTDISKVRTASIIRKVLHPFKSLNVRHLGVVAATELKQWRRGHIQWHDIPI
jgi:hypothetical protein